MSKSKKSTSKSKPRYANETQRGTVRDLVKYMLKLERKHSVDHISLETLVKACAAYADLRDPIEDKPGTTYIVSYSVDD